MFLQLATLLTEDGFWSFFNYFGNQIHFYLFFGSLFNFLFLRKNGNCRKKGFAVIFFLKYTRM